MIKHAIFDFDGTLFDSMHVWDVVGENYIRSLGREPKPYMREAIRTLSLRQSATYYKEEFNLELAIEEIMKGINHALEQFYFNEAMPKEGAVDFLMKLKESDVSMCIATSTERYLVVAALKRCGIYDLFDGVFTCNEVGHGKEEPVIYRQAMEFLKGSRDDTAVFEDAAHAVRTAKEDGFKVVGIYDKSEPGQDIVRKYSDLYIKGFSQPEEILKFMALDDGKQ